jgi:hypothetical protein
VVRRIARRELDELLEREGIVRRGLRIAVDDAVVEHVAAAGFHPRYGARPLQREIERAVSRPLARVLLTKHPTPQDILHVLLRDGTVVVSVERVDEQPPAERRRERRAAVDDSAFSRAERLVADLADRLEADEAAAFADQIRPSIDGLMALTHDASFWDDPDRARSTLQRLYRLERSLDAFEGLQHRVEGLAELTRRVRQARDRARLKEISDAVAEIDDRLLVLRLELAAAAAGAETDAAVIRITPVGPGGAEWASRLIAMYEAWAERTGREAVRGPAPYSVAVDGLATYELLRGESGLHRHVRPDRTEALARVAVSAAATDDDEADAVVVRVYEEGKRRVVRDPRTGARVSHVGSVLAEGVIDPFLIAWLHRSRPARDLEAVRQD